jgi:hypothetical protein
LLLPILQVAHAFSDHRPDTSLVVGESAKLYPIGLGAWNLVVFLTAADSDESYRVEVKNQAGFVVRSASVPFPHFHPFVILSSEISYGSVFTVCVSMSGWFGSNCTSSTHIDTGYPESIRVLAPRR